MSPLADRFPAAMDSLAVLFGRDFIAERVHRLEEIFAVTEQAWERNLSRLERVPVRYLLIAEAAPWTDAGKRPSYFYETLGGSWVGRVLQAFDIFEREDAGVEPRGGGRSAPQAQTLGACLRRAMAKAEAEVRTNLGNNRSSADGPVRQRSGNP